MYVHAAQTSSAVIEGCTFTDNNNWGVWFDSETGYAELKDNLLVGNHAGGAYITGGLGLGSAKLVNNVFSGEPEGRGVHLEMEKATVTNNTFTSYRIGLEVELSYNSAELEIYNNILWGHSDADIVIDDDIDSDDVGANVQLYNNDFSILEIEIGDNLEQSDNLDVDPKLTADFHLQPTSPVIDKGLIQAPELPDKDFEGDNRSVDANDDDVAEPDMGADEATEFEPSENGGPDASVDTEPDASTPSESDASADSTDGSNAEQESDPGDSNGCNCSFVSRSKPTGLSLFFMTLLIYLGVRRRVVR